MDSFYIIVLSIAIILLILVLTYVGIVMTYYVKKNNLFPPQASSCPDYWAVSPTDASSCVIPISKKNMGTFDISKSTSVPGINSAKTEINFADAGWKAGGVNAVCSKKSWASQNGIEWDGVTNFNDC